MFESKSELIGRLIEYPASGPIFLQGPPEVGLSAVALQIAYDSVRAGRETLYLDFKDSVTPVRTQALEHMFIGKPRTTRHMLSILKDIGRTENLTVVIDNGALIRDEWEAKSNFRALVRSAVSLAPKALLVFTSPRGVYSDDYDWKQILRVRLYRNRYFDDTMYGHEVEIASGNRSVTHFITYRDGRLCPFFEYAHLQIEAGAHPNSVFRYCGIEHQGYQKFIWEASRLKPLPYPFPKELTYDD